MGDLAVSARDRANHALDSSAVAAEAHSGWLISPALADCRRVWTDRLNQTLDEVDQAAIKLHASASSYSATDKEGARRLDAVEQELTR
ncbi:hypothetical protein [Antrihabitans cavernicola]